MKLFYLFTLLWCSIAITAQNWVWGVKATGNHQYAGDMEISTSYDGTSVVAGYFQKEMKLGDFTLNTTADYYSSIFMARISKTGKVLWAKQMEAGSSYSDYIGLTTDDDKNIYLTGAISGYIYVAKFDSTGKEIWKNDFKKKHYGYGRSIGVDQYDNVYVVGGGGGNFFSAKLDYYGKECWTKSIQVNSSNGFNINDMEVDKLGNIYFAGLLGVDSVSLDTIKLKQKSSAIYGKISPEGKFLWAKLTSGRVNGIRIALSGDNLYLSGSFQVAMKFEDTALEGLCCSNPKPFIARYDTNGKMAWAKTSHTTYELKGSTTDIITDYDGNIYLSGGYFTCYGVFCTEGDYYIDKYNPNGDVQWRVVFNHSSGDGCTSISIDGQGNLYNIGRTMASNFIEPRSESGSNSVGVGKLSTGQTTRRRPHRPITERVHYIETTPGELILNAVGQNIQWYEDAHLKQKVHSGNSYSRYVTGSDTLYVTQTIGAIESLPRQVILYEPAISQYSISHHKDTLSVPFDELIGYQWKYDREPIANAGKHFFVPEKNGLYTLVLHAGEFSRSIEFDYQRPTPPLTDTVRLICADEKTYTLSAEGDQVVWYATQTYSDTLHVGNQYTPAKRAMGQVYVRQTVKGIASRPLQVKILLSQATDSIISLGPGYLSVRNNFRLRFQWYSNDEEINGATSNTYVPTINGWHSVSITDSICSRHLKTYFVKQPVVAKRQYYLCPGDTIPEISVNGNDVTWLTVNQTTYKIDTLHRGNTYQPVSAKSMNIFLIDNENGYQSYPLMLEFYKSDFSGLKVYPQGNSIYISSTASRGYTYQWYLNNDTLPVSTSTGLFNPLFGNYRIRASFNNQCDTTIEYKHIPVYDSIYYSCNSNLQYISLPNYSFNWYTDKELTKLSTSGSYNYVNITEKDTTFYIAQQKNGITYWQGVIHIRFPKLYNAKLTQRDNKLEVSSVQPNNRYTWTFNNKVLPDTTAICIPENDGLYTVIIRAGTCTTTLQHQFVRSSLNDPASNRVELYPNPANNHLTISSLSPSHEALNIRLLSLNGQVVMSQQAVNLPQRLDISQLPAGVYMVEISGDSGVKYEKMVKK